MNQVKVSTPGKEGIHDGPQEEAVRRGCKEESTHRVNGNNSISVPILSSRVKLVGVATI